MSKFRDHMILCCLAFWAWACTQEEPARSQLVVDGLLYANQGITELRINQTTPDLATAPILDDLTVVVFWRDQQFELMRDPAFPDVFFDPTQEVEVRIGEVYALVVELGDQSITAGTFAPIPPLFTRIDKTEVAVAPEDLFSDDFLKLEWDTISIPGIRQYFTGKVEALSLDDPIIEFNSSDDPQAVFELDVTDETDLFIPVAGLRYYGPHRVIVYAVNEEYAFYMAGTTRNSSFQQFTNVQNGLGLFTALSPGDTLQFEVVLKN